jgi:hypothetical protein
MCFAEVFPFDERATEEFDARSNARGRVAILTLIIRMQHGEIRAGPYRPGKPGRHAPALKDNVALLF